MTKLSVLAFGAVCQLDAAPGKVEDHFRCRPETGRDLALEGYSDQQAQEGPTSWSSVARATKQHHRRASNSICIGLVEFADLSDGRRVHIRSDRGWTEGGRSNRKSRRLIRREDIEAYARQILQSEDDSYSAAWLCPRLRRLYRISIEPDSVTAALRNPIRIEFSDGLRQLLERRSA